MPTGLRSLRFVALLALLGGVLAWPAAAQEDEEAEETPTRIPPVFVPVQGALDNPGLFPTEVVAPIAAPSLATVEAIGLPFSGASTASPFQRTIRKIGGSGFVITPEGHIVCSPDVVLDAEVVNVTVEDEDYEAKLVCTDEFYELALLKIDDPKAKGKRFTPIKWGNSDLMPVGSPVVVMGSPATLDRTITYGFVTNIRNLRLRGARGTSTGILVPDAIEIDAALVPGNYGGPVFNARGEAIAIVNRYSSGGQENLNYTIPSNVVAPIIDQLLAKGRAFHPWLGLEPYLGYYANKTLAVYLGVPIREVNPDTGEPYGVFGVLVNSVSQSSPAAESGLSQGDLIIKLNGQLMRDTKDLELAVLAMGPEESFTLTIVRNGNVFTKRITIADRPTLKEQQEHDIRIQAYGI